jgi:hypothetical protein
MVVLTETKGLLRGEGTGTLFSLTQCFTVAYPGIFFFVGRRGEGGFNKFG